MPLAGKFWITQDGTVDVTLSEHALYAKRIILKLTPDEVLVQQNMFTPLTIAEVEKFEKRGVSKEALAYLSKPGNDPRIFAIQQYGWVRVRPHRFYVWRLTDDAVHTIRGAKDFWKLQTAVQKNDHVDILEVATSDVFQLTVGVIRAARTTAASIRRRFQTHSDQQEG